MERNSLNNGEDSGVGGKNLRGNSSSSNKIKNSRDYNNHCFEEDFLGRFSWPPRSYTCSFCKREFRSAQALGGHMNVHRRDRARLRQSPPWDGSYPNLSPNPNPNPNLSSSSPTRVPPITYAFPSLLSSSTTCLSSLDPSSSRGGDHRKMKTLKALYEIGELEGFRQEDDQCKILKKAEIVGLDLELEIGLDRDLKEDLDLELRLGCS